MKYLIIVVFFLLGFVSLSAQEKHFIFIQSDNNQAFYVQMNGKLYSSSATGYMILSKLVKGTYNFIVGFPQNAFPEQSFECSIDTKDLGFNLKNFGEKGWGLFNLQTFEVIKATQATANEPPKIVLVDTPKIADGEPIITFNTKPKEAIKPVVKQPEVVVNTEVLNTEPLTTQNIFKANIKKPIIKTIKTSKPLAIKKVQPETPVVKDVDTVVAITKPIDNKPVDEAKAYTKQSIVEDGTFLIYISEPEIKVNKKAVIVVPAETNVTNTPQNTTPIKVEDVLKIDIAKTEVKANEGTLSNSTVKDTVFNANIKSEVKKVGEVKNEEGLSMTFVDEKGQIKDTIQAIIPVLKSEVEIPKLDTTTAQVKLPIVITDTPIVKVSDSIVVVKKQITEEPLKEKQETEIINQKTVSVKSDPGVAKTEIKETKVEEMDSLIKKEPIKTVTQPPVSIPPNSPATIVESKPLIVVKDTIVPQSVAYDSPLNDKNKTTETLSESVKTTPGSLVANKCTALAFEEDYYKLRKKMLNQMSDEKMISEAKKVYQSKCFTTAQVKALSVLFMSDEGRYKFFDASYNFVVDPDKFPALQSELIDAYYVGRFKAMLR